MQNIKMQGIEAVNSLSNQVWVAMPQPELEALKGELQEIKSICLNSKEDSFLNRWVESEEARKQLGICPRTWQGMRDNRTIPFSQFGRKIYVRQSDIEAFLESNLVK
ncbi:MAG: helix-turn-helix domain-containing protein [Butyrivibrio sp.]|nr:helix-turn-helix domain-containing protein [Butyrivibrio sp.]